MGKPKAASLGHCIKSCILDKLGDCEKPSAHADALGMATSDNDVLWCDKMSLSYSVAYATSLDAKKLSLSETAYLVTGAWVA
ncbi:hypothetical protein GCM10020331_011280 [Ectobacillus funiculus]